MTDAHRGWEAGFSRVIKERKIELMFLLLLAVIFYLVSISVLLSSPETADRIAEKARQSAPGQDWVAFKREVAQELETRDRHAEARELLLHLAIAFSVAIIILIAFDMRSESEARKRFSSFMDNLGQQLQASDSQARASLTEFLADLTKKQDTSDSQAKASLTAFLAGLTKKQDEIARNLYSGVFGRYLPESLTNEIENIILGKFVKEDCSYTLVFSADHADELAVSNRFVLKRELRFKVRNFTLETASFKIASRFTNTDSEVVGGKPFPGHRGLWVGKEDRTSEIATPPVVQPEAKAREVAVEVAGKQCSKEITLFSEEIMSMGPMERQNSYTQVTPAANLRIRVRNELDSQIEITRVCLIPSSKDFEEVAPGEYFYSRGLLPGQGCMVAWKSKS